MASGGLYIRSELIPALRLLLASYRYGLCLEGEEWRFAVGIRELRRRGASREDIRWLVISGFARHRREVTLAGDNERTFRELAITECPARSVLMLTEKGARFLLCVLPVDGVETKSSGLLPNERKNGVALSSTSRDKSPKSPVWDGALRELRVGEQVVKRFRVPAPNQEMILRVFEEEQWPNCIDDPLPPRGDVQSKERLVSTIKSLNRCQIKKLITFHGNGNGRQVYWDYSAA